jgi:hypothetical protein
MPATPGIQNILKILDPGFHWNGGKSEFQTSYVVINFLQYALFN